jgi:two-component system, OmpR family, KDP operon response regulator KdpE
MTHVLVVDDEPQIVRALTISLTARDYVVTSAHTGQEALDLARSTLPDIVVLDLGLPDIDGIEVVRALRERSTVPIIILSGRNQGASKVRALDAGADDYVTKPFDLEELLARLRAAERRAPVVDSPLLVTVGELTIDLQAHRVSKGDGEGDGADVRLTPTEWQLLEVLARNPGKLITQKNLLRAINRANYVDESHYLRQFMNQLRRKLEPDPARPRYLLTEPGMGYRFQP